MLDSVESCDMFTLGIDSDVRLLAPRPSSTRIDLLSRASNSSTTLRKPPDVAVTNSSASTAPGVQCRSTAQSTSIASQRRQSRAVQAAVSACAAVRHRSGGIGAGASARAEPSCTRTLDSLVA